MLKQSLQQKLPPEAVATTDSAHEAVASLRWNSKRASSKNLRPTLRWKKVEQDESLDDLDAQDQETSDALDDFDFDEYLDDETPDYQLSVRNHGADVEDRDIPLGSGASFRSCWSTNWVCSM